MKDYNTTIEAAGDETLELELPQESIGGGFVRRLLNVIPVDIEALLKELDEEV